MYATGKLCMRYVTLAPTYANVCEIQQVRWCTLNKLEISCQYVTNTLQYGGIRCHTAKRSRNFVHSYTLDIRWMYATCKLCIR